MSGRLMKMVRKDAKLINKNIGWEEDISISTPDGSVVLATKAIHTEHHLSFDTEGQKVNSKNAHILVCEDDLKDANYPYRNSTTNVHLLGHKITVNSDMGIKHFVVSENYPSETFGMIVLILQDTNTDKNFNGTNSTKYTNPKF